MDLAQGALSPPIAVFGETYPQVKCLFSWNSMFDSASDGERAADLHSGSISDGNERHGHIIL